MTSTPTIPPLTGTITVDVPVERAFRAFTDAFGSWWPAEYHIGQADMATAILEPRQGGRWYEQGTDGSECDWGRVLAWEPPHRLVVTWQINGQWQYDPDPAHASEIEVRFTADGPDQTTVELEHRRLERLVDGQALRDGITGGGGWPASWSCSPRPQPTRPDPDYPSRHLTLAIRSPLARAPRSGQRLHHPSPARARRAPGWVRAAWRRSGCRPPGSGRHRSRPAPRPRWCQPGRRRKADPWYGTDR